MLWVFSLNFQCHLLKSICYCSYWILSVCKMRPKTFLSHSSVWTTIEIPCCVSTVLWRLPVWFMVYVLFGIILIILSTVCCTDFAVTNFCHWRVPPDNYFVSILGTETNGLCNLSSPSFLEWDAMTLFIECVMSRIGMTDFTPDSDNGVALLKSVLAYQSQVSY